MTDFFAFSGVCATVLPSVTVVLVVVGLLRKSWRRRFGAERAYALWIMPPLALLMACLPHASGILSAGIEVPMVSAWHALPGVDAPAVLERVWITPSHIGAVWLAGVCVWLAFVALAQVQFRRRMRGAVAVNTPEVEAWLSTSALAGPVLVGVWRPRIVLPADFFTRYDADERALILAHEATHARRGDVFFLHVAQGVGALLWFHPLVWWALRAFRHDQELACDAAVLRHHPGRRRSYAHAMLKSHDSLFLPVGCTWSSRHPLNERIAMLNTTSFSSRSRRVATACLTVTVAATSMVAYAVAPSAVEASTGQTYQLAAAFEHNGTLLSPTTVCMPDHVPATIVDNGDHRVELRFVVSPVSNDTVKVDIDATEQVNGKAVTKHQSLSGPLGQPLVLENAGQSRMSITPQKGCPAAEATKTANLVSQVVDKGSARGAAMSVAMNSGFVLDNPEVLDEQPVGFGFAHLDARKALELIADIDGRTVSFSGNHARFRVK
ncbi:beta-lactamase regulating signal transducer with metallopeptidase domain [Luteibacter sp. Sphag1AF]|uniref:M56 family metallopeptidase n=1 Tax=Luteibacter sp. Sphag1AF TaxID=2587031 RepID=UPI00161CED5D|nr:M56 family metallopeptidase [Luteibacter sp. Sphag1AF]MBB3225944.1 beta-lactamase regulating signal transducer with metallopeptidase domain [Luteibacter sp. Sphag1AF]